MAQDIAAVALVVRDYDEAIGYFTGVLGFSLLEDVSMGAGKRWVRVAPPGSASPCLLLARAANEAQERCIGQQAGGRVFLFLHTTDFWGDYQRLSALGVRFTEQPREESYGTVAVFEDLYGNRWDLVQNKPA